nr:400_t:CDS:2 [Entrophospora candida]
MYDSEPRMSYNILKSIAEARNYMIQKLFSKMPVPFEAIIPLGIIMGMFGVTGTLINLSRRYQHDWKPERFQLDRWDKLMMERDRRLTGSLYGQTSNPTAPPSFSTNSVWYLKVHRTTKTTPNLLKEQLIQTFYPEHQTHELLLSHSLQQQVSESNGITNGNNS